MLYIRPFILNSYYCYNEFSFNNLNYCFRYDGVSKLLSDQKIFSLGVHFCSDDMQDEFCYFNFFAAHDIFRKGGIPYNLS